MTALMVGVFLLAVMVLIAVSGAGGRLARTVFWWSFAGCILAGVIARSR